MARLLFLAFCLSVIAGRAAAVSQDGKSPFRAEWYGRKVNDSSLGLPQRLVCADSLIATSTGSGYWKAWGMKVEILEKMGRCDEALALCDSIVPLLPSSEPLTYRQMVFKQGMLSLTLRRYLRVVEHAYSLLKLRGPDSLRRYEVMAYPLLCDFFMVVNVPWLSRRYAREALSALGSMPLHESFEESEREMDKHMFYQALAESWIAQEEWDSAHAAIAAARKLRHSDKPVLRLVELTQLGAVAEKQGNVEMAADYYRKALDMGNINLNHICAVLGYMRQLVKMGDFSGFKKMMQRYAPALDKVRGTSFEREAAEVMRDYYMAIGDWREVSRQQQRIVDFADSLQSATGILAAQQIIDLYENRPLEERIARAESGSRKRGWIIAVMAVLLACAAGAVAIFYRRYRAKAQSARKLGEYVEQIKKTNIDSLQESAESVEVKSQQLTAMTMLMGRLNEALARIQEEAGNNGAPAGERLASIRAIAADLDREENVWKMFRTYFESVNQSFFDRLFRLCPSLTNAEVRMCAFILLNLTTKEIAILTNRSVRTVETIRHNLRKKLCINGPSEVFMRRISTASPTAFEDMLSTDDGASPDAGVGGDSCV